ncbi:MAG: transferrin-binding protein-like solute binding protein, partial [Proteobacteria bacterium]|nr:transferrin-binding protein-like solute binding protein [Pseudomonadota bacterium]
SVDGFTDFALARTNRLTFCNDNMNVANGLCTGENLMNVCVADPFNAICFTDATYLPARITNCITGGNAGDMKCDTIVSDSTMNDAITNCLENPFATACESVSAFTTFALARTNRVSFCEIGGNESNALCMDTTLTNLCEFNIFSTACIGQPNIPNLRVASCLDDGNMNKDPSCAEVLLVNHADYLATFATPPPATVAAAVASTAILSHFLSVGEGGIDTTGLGDVTPVTLRLGGDNDDEGDNPNGVTFVDGEIQREIQGFVGLLPTTNLGAPLVEAPMDTTWEGRYLSGLDLTTYPITFTVNFGTKKITGADTQTYITDFDLDFTATGVITGNVSASLGGRTDTAPVRGLIGEQGLVGAFANTDGGTRGGTFYGGFVAENPSYTPPMNGN